LKFLRMREVPPFLHEHGFKIGQSTIAKLTAPSVARGPPFNWWGPFKMFGDETTLEWARENLSPGGPKPQKFHAIDRKEKASTS
jgi:hypothetical protein